MKVNFNLNDFYYFIVGTGQHIKRENSTKGGELKALSRVSGINLNDILKVTECLLVHRALLIRCLN